MLSGSTVTEVMKRFGRPCAFAMCQPFEVIRAGGAEPPTFVAIPFLNLTFAFRMSQTPQKPTYAASPWRSIADIELFGSLAGSVAGGAAFGSPGLLRVPRSNTCF